MLIETKVIWIWIHLMGVILWAGGFFYVLVGLLPALQSGRTTEERVDLSLIHISEPTRPY